MGQNSMSKNSFAIKKPNGDEFRQRLDSQINFSPDTSRDEHSDLRLRLQDKSREQYFPNDKRHERKQKKSNNDLKLKLLNESAESNNAQDEDIRESLVERNLIINLPTGYVLATKSNSKSLLNSNKVELSQSESKRILASSVI